MGILGELFHAIDQAGRPRIPGHIQDPLPPPLPELLHLPFPHGGERGIVVVFDFLHFRLIQPNARHQDDQGEKNEKHHIQLATRLGACGGNNQLRLPGSGNLLEYVQDAILPPSALHKLSPNCISSLRLSIRIAILNHEWCPILRAPKDSYSGSASMGSFRQVHRPRLVVSAKFNSNSTST